MVSASKKTTKKIIVGCDGTWLNSDDGASYLDGSKDTLVTPSNVTRLCRALQPRPPKGAAKAGNTDRGNTQVVQYKPGIGSARNYWDHYVNGASADSIADNIRDAYVSVLESWEEDSEIFLLGFSRGSFVARSVAAMICAIGVLNKEGMEDWYDIFQDWENQNDPNWIDRKYKPKDGHEKGSKNFKPVPGDDYSSYARQLESDGLTTLEVPIKAVACWDTVGSLGIPQIHLDWPIIGSLLNPIFRYFDKTTRRLAFIDTFVLRNVRNCFHALALDEIRRSFSPTLWEIPDDRETPITLKQCWFPGAHGNCGGSINDAELPDVALAWMTAQLIECGLEFDDDYLAFCRKVNQRYYTTTKQPPRGWGMGYIYNPFSGFAGWIERMGGKKERIPGHYTRLGLPKTPLRQTNETVHPAVRVRIHTNGKGMEDKGDYKPDSLAGFELRNDESKHDPTSPTQKGYWWEAADGTRLPEENLEEIEKMLLETYKGKDTIKAWEDRSQ